jgi:hypothetical protein
MSGMWKRGTVGLVRHRQTKEPEMDRPDLNNRATSRLYRDANYVGVFYVVCIEKAYLRKFPN